MAPALTGEGGGRPTCLRCWKPAPLCVCGRLTPLENCTEILVLQHPREEFHAIGTVRLLALGLTRVRVETARLPGAGTGRPRAEHTSGAEAQPGGAEARPESTEGPPGASVARPSRQARLPFALGPRAAVLYPGEGARLVETLAPEERPEQLVVLDGTWHHAKTLFRDHPELHGLPRLALAPSTPGRYRLRAEPTPLHVSTVEAVVLALSALEPEPERFAALITAFDSMIDDQARFVEARVGGARQARRTRERAFLSLPRALCEDHAELWVAHTERARSPGGSSGVATTADARAFLGLVRPATGEAFSWGWSGAVPAAAAAAEAAAGAVSAEAEVRARQGSDAARVGAVPADIAAEFTARVGRAPLCAWSEEVLTALPPTAGQRVALRGVVKRHGHVGRLVTLSDAVAPAGAALPAERGPRTLARVAWVAAWLHAQTGG